MKKIAALVVCLPVLLLMAQSPKGNEPRYTGKNQLLRPANYREWVWLSSGFGMAYGPATQNMHDQSPPFDNVFVNPEAYRSFLQTGTWPDKTMFVLEVRSSAQNGSINKNGYFQGDTVHMEVHVKDEKRFARKWAFYPFPETSTASAEPFADTSDCYTCHEKSGGLDTTFAQFYPTVRDVARQKGTLHGER